MMNPLKHIKLAAVGMTAAALIAGSAFAQDGKAIFKQNCAACHSVGKGRLVGPDLKGVTNKRTEEWLLKFIKSSQTFIKTDAEAKALFDQFQIQMPDQNIHEGDIKAILAYIKSESPAETVTASENTQSTTPEQTGRDISTATKDEILYGQELFAGIRKFNNGGPACLSCHNVTWDAIGIGGGTLAKDLTTVYERLAGQAGVNGILSAPPFPAMAAAYQNHALTEDEAFRLTAFLAQVNQEHIYQHPGDYRDAFYLGGGIGLASLLALISIFWFGRKKKSVKHGIFKRQLKSI